MVADVLIALFVLVCANVCVYPLGMSQMQECVEKGRVI